MELSRAGGDACRIDRLVSLDQFRGYTVAGMFLVNFLGSYGICPRILRHTHDYISYADTIMPQFLFAVGFALRLSSGRRLQTQGRAAASFRMVRRMLGLVLVSLVVYSAGRPAETWEQLSELGIRGAIRDPLKRTWFQTLMHIAVTSLWLVPVVHARPAVRIAWMLASAAAHVGLSWWFNFVWVNTNPNGIDGGPLGFLTWTIPATVGTLACDVFLQPREKLRFLSAGVLGTVAVSLLLMGAGYLVSCGTRLYDVPLEMVEALKGEKLAASPVWPDAEQRAAALADLRLEKLLAEPPFVPPPGPDQRKWNYWMMSQRAGTLAYLTFSAGFSLAVYVVFFVCCDLWGMRLGMFQTLGTNALLAYVLHDLVGSAVKPFVPGDAPAWYVLGAFSVFFAITWLFVRHFEKQGLYLRA